MARSRLARRRRRDERMLKAEALALPAAAIPIGAKEKSAGPRDPVAPVELRTADQLDPYTVGQRTGTATCGPGSIRSEFGAVTNPGR